MEGIRTYIRVTFQQQSSVKFPSRSASFVMPFVDECEINSSWKNLTDTCKIKFPRNIYMVDQFGNRFSLINSSTLQPLNFYSSVATTPFILKGDKITVEAGYKYFDNENKEKLTTNVIFNGYVTKINTKTPIELECEDNMFKLKNILCPNKTFLGSKYTLQSMLEELLQGSGFTVNTNGDTISIGDFVTRNETVAMIIERLRKNYRIESYFRGNELRSSLIVYYPIDRSVAITTINQIPVQSIFRFQQNIITDELFYSRTDDINIGIKAYSFNKLKTGKINNSGKVQTSTKRLEVFVAYNNGKFISSVVTDNKIQSREFGADYFGEVRTLFFQNVTSADDLIKKATDNLSRFFYEGYQGSFTTFGLPRVQHGDIIAIRDNLFPERNGLYFVKSVTSTFNVEGGFKQKVELDIRVDGVYSTEQLSAGI